MQGIRRRGSPRWRLPAVALALSFTAVALAQTRTVTFSRALMGAEFRILVATDDSSGAARAADAAFRRIDTLNAVLSDYQPDSELNRLSDTAGSDSFVVVSADLWNALARASEIARRTEGAFDPTVGALTRLWRRAFRRNSLPDATAIAGARATVGYRSIDFDTNLHAVRLSLPGTRLDLGGIGKGYAADQALALLEELGFNQALVDAGGDVRLGKPPPGRQGWHVLVPSLDTEGQPSQIAVSSPAGAVAASGDTYRFLEADGVRYSHIIDPRTGMGVTHRRIVAVAAPDCTHADALASALSVVEPERLPALLERFPGVSARILSPRGDRFVLIDSEGWSLKNPIPE